MALYGMNRKMFKNLFASRLILDAGNDATPSHAPLYLLPGAEPTNGAEGAVYFDSTLDTLMVSDGTTFNRLALANVISPSLIPVKNGVTILTAADSGALCVWSTAAGYLYTLPTAAVGLHFDFLVTTTITSVGAKVLTQNASDFIVGVFRQSTDGTYTVAEHVANGTDIRSWNGNGTTTGGYAGDWFRLVAISASQWAIQGMGRATGSEATPFATS